MVIAVVTFLASADVGPSDGDGRRAPMLVLVSGLGLRPVAFIGVARQGR
ncbi:MAG: hypothetical protein WKG07_06505 [Hymenobacter sp.]